MAQKQIGKLVVSKLKINEAQNALFSEDELKELQEIFKLLTNDDKFQVINVKQLQIDMQQAKIPLTNPYIYQIIQKLAIQVGDDQNIRFEDFLNAVTQKFDDTKSRSGLNNIFDLLDTSKANIINLDCLKQMIQLVNMQIPEDDLNSKLQEYTDKSKTKGITREDFYEIMTKNLYF